MANSFKYHNFMNEGSTMDGGYNSHGQNEDVHSSTNWWNAWNVAVWRAALIRNAFNGAYSTTKDSHWVTGEGENVNERMNAPAMQSTVEVDGKRKEREASMEKEVPSIPGSTLVLISSAENGSSGANRLPQQQCAYVCDVPVQVKNGQRIRIGIGQADFEVTVNAARAIFCQTDPVPRQSYSSSTTEDTESTNTKDTSRRLSLPTDLCNQGTIKTPPPPAKSCNENPADAMSVAQTDYDYYSAYTAHQLKAYGSWLLANGSKPMMHKSNNRRHSHDVQTCTQGVRRKREISVAEAAMAFDDLEEGRINGDLDTARQSVSSTVDGVDLEEIRHFAKLFKMKRLSLGLTQTQVGQTLSLTNGPAYSQSAICRFEKLDITPKSALKIKPVLERWLQEVEDQIKAGGGITVQRATSPPTDDTKSVLAGCEADQFQDSAIVKAEELGGNYADHSKEKGPSESTITNPMTNTNAETGVGCKRRKRRTSFTPQALELLSDYFRRNRHPTGAEMTSLAGRLNYDREVIRVWFCNKRQALKNTCKRARTTD